MTCHVGIHPVSPLLLRSLEQRQLYSPKRCMLLDIDPTQRQWRDSPWTIALLNQDSWALALFSAASLSTHLFQ